MLKKIVLTQGQRLGEKASQAFQKWQKVTSKSSFIPLGIEKGDNGIIWPSSMSKSSKEVGQMESTIFIKRRAGSL